MEEARKKKFSFKPISSYTYSKLTKIQTLINNCNSINDVEDGSKFHERIKQRRKKCNSKTTNNLSGNSNSEKDLDDEQLEIYLNLNKIISEMPPKLQSLKKSHKDTSGMIADTLGNSFSALSISEESVQDYCMDFANSLKQFQRAVKTLNTQKENYQKYELQLEKLRDFASEVEAIVPLGKNINTVTLGDEQEKKIIGTSQAIADVLSIQKTIESFIQTELGEDFLEHCDVVEPILDDLLRNIS